MSFDGVKLARELSKWWRAWRDGDNTTTHTGGGWVNRWVEGARASPYGAGHVDAILVPLLIVAAAAGWLCFALIYLKGG